MIKCGCYHEKITHETWYDSKSKQIVGSYYPRIVGECWGTKECEECTCGGDPEKCNFYPKKERKEVKTMNFAEAWVEAQATDKYYINRANQIVYQKDIGLVEADDFTQRVEIDNFDYGIESIMRAEWEVMDVSIMTKEEAEKKFGIKIVG